MIFLVFIWLRIESAYWFFTTSTLITPPVYFQKWYKKSSWWFLANTQEQLISLRRFMVRVFSLGYFYIFVQVLPFDKYWNDEFRDPLVNTLAKRKTVIAHYRGVMNLFTIAPRYKTAPISLVVLLFISLETLSSHVRPILASILENCNLSKICYLVPMDPNVLLWIH